LSRDSVDLDVGTLTIDRQYVELRDGRLVLDTPKAAAGFRRNTSRRTCFSICSNTSTATPPPNLP